MKVFKKDYKLNFVDDNNVVLGWDDESSCCENFGYFFSREIPKKIEDEPGHETGIETALDGYNFDTKFFQEARPEEEYFDEGGMAIFRLTRGDDQMFLTLYNSHNGYYSHGFELEVGGTKIADGSL